MVKIKVIGVDLHVYDGIYQGSRSHVIELFRRAIKIAPEFKFYFFLESIEKLKLEYSEFTLPNVVLVRMKYKSGLFRMLFQLPYLQIKYKLDLLHTQYRVPFMMVGACACTIHDVLFEDFPEYFKPLFVWQSKITFRLAAKKAKILFSVSNYSKNRISELYNIDSNKITVLYNGVDNKKFYPATDSNERLSKFHLRSKGYILTVGRLEPRKNHVRLIQAYAKLNIKDIPLVIVGQKDFGYQPILDLIRDLSISNRVIILDNIDDEMLPILMRNAKIFVFPAFAEGFGMPVLEAMSSGVPTITSNTTAFPEIVGDAAILVNPLNIEDIATAISNILSDNEHYNMACNNAYERSKLFNWQSVANLLISRYKEFFDGKA